ncbi:MAG: threonine synthase [Ignavibacteria bacterium]|nr:threonine synthase [Ignavibacteria bacterium]MBT8383813.1 threonine synthase [Ignavibacteria bacterium]MBT8391584.1 threonine synthase [Ignavibacteria bacterium]NNL20781.1 threonine synthase [Ignavibacteriaceae bacterium]
MSSYSYKCFKCSEIYSVEEIEKGIHYLCPKCGKSEKNKPLEGVLTVEYHYNELEKKISREEFLRLTPGKFWLYPDLWPLDFNNFEDDQLNKLALPADQLFNYKIDGKKLLIQDETRNPTLSYKDRATSLVVLKAIELGITEIAAASTGNAGSSLAGICSRLGLKSRIYVPQNIPEEKRIQIEAYGAELKIVEGDYDKAFDLCLEDSKKNNWYNRNTAYNPLTIEGKKSAAYDIFVSAKGEIPDVIFVPVGDGVIISGIYKGFKELLTLGWIDKLPKLIAVQSTGSDALVRYFNTGKFEYKAAKTLADSILAGAPRNLYLASDAVKKSNGIAIAVTDEEILLAQKEFIKQTGILCEPSCATTYAAYKSLAEKDKIDSSIKVLLLITGNGLKNITSLRIKGV